MSEKEKNAAPRQHQAQPQPPQTQSQQRQQPYPYYYYPPVSPAYYPANARQMQQQSPQTTAGAQQQTLFNQPAAQQNPYQSQSQGMLPIEQSYIENILRLNRGKLATFYMTFENNSQWNAKTFTGIIEAAGRDHIIISDPNTGQRILLLMVYLDYVTFPEEIQYSYPNTGNPQQLSNYSQR